MIDIKMWNLVTPQNDRGAAENKTFCHLLYFTHVNSDHWTLVGEYKQLRQPYLLGGNYVKIWILNISLTEMVWYICN